MASAGAAAYAMSGPDTDIARTATARAATGLRLTSYYYMRS
jgi:hypothetical protein